MFTNVNTPIKLLLISAELPIVPKSDFDEFLFAFKVATLVISSEELLYLTALFSSVEVGTSFEVLLINAGDDVKRVLRRAALVAVTALPIH